LTDSPIPMFFGGHFALYRRYWSPEHMPTMLQ
jgi:hypothetical protein